MKKEEYKKLNHELMHHGRIVDFYADTVELPNGELAHWDFIQHRGAAAIVPVLPDGRILMVRQYRVGPDQITLEIPAGGLNGDEEMITCATRECEEETGYRVVGEAKHLITIYTTPAFCNERIGIFYADHLEKSHQHLDPDEFVNVEAKTIDELTQMILNHEIIDTKTVTAVLTYKALIEQKK
ncbi:MAG: NUDIX hydrolase [Lachnospiraceae bacterium]|nr:NUDIX hydrolase [Lachnospiraceae bacterium]